MIQTFGTCYSNKKTFKRELGSCDGLLYPFADGNTGEKCKWVSHVANQNTRMLTYSLTNKYYITQVIRELYLMFWINIQTSVGTTTAPIPEWKNINMSPKDKDYGFIEY